MKGCLFGGGGKSNDQSFKEHIARLQWEVQYERSQRSHFQQAYHKELVRNGVLEHELATSAEAAKELKRSLMSFLGDEAHEDDRGMDAECRRPRKMLRRQASTSVASSMESDDFLEMTVGNKENVQNGQMNRLAERLLNKASNLQNRLLSTSTSFTAQEVARSSHSNSAATHTTFTSSEASVEVARPAERQTHSYYFPRQEHSSSWQSR